MLIAALCVLPFCAHAQEKTERLDSVVVSASRAGKDTPITFTTVGKEVLKEADPSASLPMALNLLPSVVTYNEGGTGLGNSAMTIRGSKGSQINVTLNGITLNDAESQEVFWVNIPSLTSLISNVQVQRGLGTSASGAGAFGASINMNTSFVGDTLSAAVDIGGGSYGTFVGSMAVSSGLLKGGFYMNLAGNLAHTDGYIRNARVDSQSLYAALGWLGKRNSMRFTYLLGRQKSGITWDGISLEQYRMDRRYNGAGMYYDDAGNVRYYPNQTDNYAQHHFQLNYTHAFRDGLIWSNTLNYSRGDGYDEYYKMNRKFKNYGFPDTFSGKSDMIYRKLMDNDLLVFNSNIRYRSPMLDITGGVNLSMYRGGHWGNVLWAKEAPADFNYHLVNWYDNKGLKDDESFFVRAEYHPLGWLTAYADLQLRTIGYYLYGTDDDWLEYGAAPEDIMNYRRRWVFFNPRAGVTAAWGPHKLYASAALGHREPGRADIKENIKGEGAPIEPEKMLDVEAGYELHTGKVQLSANIYLMEYWDMLVETGRLSSSGYAIKENVPRAWRRGIELCAGWNPARWFRADGNVTLSINRIEDYTSYIPYDDYSGTHAVSYGRTDILMSPSVVGMLKLTFAPWEGGMLSFDGKYVGKQYIDNSMRDDMAIPAYWVANLSAGQDFKLKNTILGVRLYVNNLFNRLYYASGWRWETYNPDTGVVTTGIGVYPQAPRNFMIKLSLSF